MALNPNIILAGQAPDVIGSMARGQEAGMQAMRGQRENALAGLYQTQGAGILAGDQGALNALAGLSPEAAMAAQSNLLGNQQARLGMDQTRQNMAFDREEMQMKRRAAAEAAKAQVAAMSAADRAAAAQKIETGLRGAIPFFEKGDKAGFAAYVQAQGLDPNQFTIEAFPSAIAEYTGVLDALKTYKEVMTPKQDTISPNERFKVVGNQLYDLGAEGGPKVIGEAPGQEETVFGPDGKPIMMRGPAGSTTKFTEGQSKDNVYVTRAEGALRSLTPIAGALTSVVERGLEYDPTGVVRGAVQSDDFQKATQAGREFLQAILRKDTGAAITSDEEALYGQTYLPQPGDNAAVQAAKAKSRIRAVEAIKSGMSAAQLEATARADAATIAQIAAGAAPPPPAAPSDPAAMSDDDLLKMYGG